MQVSVVITSWNKINLTKECLSYFDARDGIEVIVVDNGSTDGTRQLLEARAGITKILNPINRGFSYAINQGIEASTKKYVVLTQNDVFLYESSRLKNIESLFASLPGCQCIGFGGGYVNNYNIREITWKNGDDEDSHRREPFFVEEVGFVAGFFMFCDRAFLKQHNIRMDTQYNPYWEDVDFCMQIKRKDGRCYMVSRALLEYRHIRSATITPSLGGAEREARRRESLSKFKNKWNPTESKLLKEYEKRNT